MRLLTLCVLLAGCSGEGDCLEDLPEACTPLYEPVYDEVWQNTLSPSCAHVGCHGGGAASGGLSLEDAETAYTSLVDGGYVEPGSAACSALVDVIEPSGSATMPPGAPLDEAALCAVRQWIDAGADR